MSPLRSSPARRAAGQPKATTGQGDRSLDRSLAYPGARVLLLAEHRQRNRTNAGKTSTALIVESNEVRYSIEGPAGKLSPFPLPAALTMSRPTARHARNGALASLGLYSIVILVLLALTGGFDRASHVQADNIDRSALFQRVNQVVPNALAVLQQSFSPRS
ncbi:hypothetical membrane protein [Pseudomonas knackmussii B13]|uniref:Hypothetical membrane protein n=2 Tax=Pseudomonas knackmussii TaxID=65741 RepID=A0A024HF60_PSEKB|nr:hypothetical membrane protein [Pseudomonas knackmussii B13]